MRHYSMYVATAIIVGLFAAAQVSADLVRIADTNTPVFGGTGHYTSFDPPSTNRNALPEDPVETTFHARGSDGSDAIYYFTNLGNKPTTTRQVDQTSTISPSESLASINSISFGYFSGVGTSGTTGIFGNGPKPGPLGKFAASGDPSPSGGTFTSFGGVADDQFTLGPVFRSGTGIYQFIGQTQTLTTISHINDPYGQTYYGDPAIAGAEPSGGGGSSVQIIAFHQGVLFDHDTMYVQVGTNAVKAVKTVFADPDVDGGMLLSNPSASRVGVFFTVHASTVAASVSGYLFTSLTTGAGNAITVATTASHVPGAAAGVTFTSFGDVSAGDDFSPLRCAFTATTSDGVQGIYLDDSFGNHTKLIDTSTSFDGKTPISFDISPAAIEENNLAFLVNFSDGSSGIYSTEGTLSVPEPACGLAGLALCAVAIRARRR